MLKIKGVNGKLWSVNEVLKVTGVSRYTLHRDTKNGKINVIRFGKALRYREEDVIKYAEDKKNSKLVNLYKQKKAKERA